MTMVAYDNVVFTQDVWKIGEDSEEYASTEGQLYEDLSRIALEGILLRKICLMFAA